MFALDVPQTIAEAFRQIHNGEDPWQAIGNFSHDWYGNYPTPEQRCALVAEPIKIGLSEPEHEASQSPEQQMQLRQWAAFCAASVEYLCKQARLEVPAWVQNADYILSEDQSFYTSPAAATKPKVRERLRQQAPEAFRRRNVFCSNRVYANKYTATPIHKIA
ncbi:hypothetical protein KSC_105530 [Ktedonobacter sp. SOSP1-52]|uniref:hypothetical protein n=1 Tax=Ktedonobacter sp. SOSP1-52 TaxID=2778366 RepID=UPI001A18339E|nr:hypothetical protein [Ktedonobacter sp. SOSP1-52]GHO71661.1 hypothetical protein KSC_105530 [Ktedonobacter sp. SOSP1-52]